MFTVRNPAGLSARRLLENGGANTSFVNRIADATYRLADELVADPVEAVENWRRCVSRGAASGTGCRDS